jgi:hypothetical protein
MVICKGANGKWGSEFVGSVIHADGGIPSACYRRPRPPVVIGCRDLRSSVDVEEVRMYASRLEVWRRKVAAEKDGDAGHWKRNDGAQGGQGEIGSDEGRGTGAVSSQSGRYPCQHAGTVGVDL